jgi:hypothetical protein
MTAFSVASSLLLAVVALHGNKVLFDATAFQFQPAAVASRHRGRQIVQADNAPTASSAIAVLNAGKSNEGDDAETNVVSSAVAKKKKTRSSNSAASKDKAGAANAPSATGDNKARLARATASLQAKRKAQADSNNNAPFTSSASSSSYYYPPTKSSSPSKIKRYDDYYYNQSPPSSSSSSSPSASSLIDLKKKIDQKIQRNNWNRTGQRRRVNNDSTLFSTDQSGGKKLLSNKLPQVHVQHETDSMQSLLGYNHFEGEWSDRNATTYHVVIVFGKGLINDQISIEYATRIRTLVKLLKEEESFQPKLICFTGGNDYLTSINNNNNNDGLGGGGGGAEKTISDASAGYVYFLHLCASQNIHINPQQTNVYVDKRNGVNERDAMERVASELWRRYIKSWLKERPLTERKNQHYGVGWHILERRVDIHFTLISTEYHLCNLNDVHHRSPGKSFLQPLVSLRGLVGSDRWVNKDELEAMDPSYSSSVHVSSNTAPLLSESDRASFAGIENSVDTSWSFQYGTYPFLHGKEDSIVFLGQCYLLGEELTPLLVNMKGVVEQVSCI